jgi:hypothetical protein
MRASYIAGLVLLALINRSETLGATRDVGASAVFINEGRAKVQINVISKDTREQGVMILPPRAIERSVLFAGGQVRLYTPSKDIVSGRLLFSRSLPSPTTAAEFLEKESRTFYFRVAGRKITLIKPTELSPKEKTWLAERTKGGW